MPNHPAACAPRRQNRELGHTSNCSPGIDVTVFDAKQIRGGDAKLRRPSELPRTLSHDPKWLNVLDDGLKQSPYLVVATSGQRRVGFLPLSLVSTILFGRYLVSLPYLNTAGIQATDSRVAGAMIDRAVQLADDLRVKHLELRHEKEVCHSALTQKLTTKVHLRLPLPTSCDELWQSFKPKVRNQIRKGEKQQFLVSWGRSELVHDFYTVFSANMRDLGTPVYSKRLFSSILESFPDQSEICVVRQGNKPVSAALLLHGAGVTEVPSASSLRLYNSTNVNMFMYWQLLQRSVERKQEVFDFGRSTIKGNTYRFKKQWGAMPEPAVWQYYVRHGSSHDLRRENRKFELFISLWRRLPVCVTRIIGPAVVRGIP